MSQQEYLARSVVEAPHDTELCDSGVVASPIREWVTSPSKPAKTDSADQPEQGTLS